MGRKSREKREQREQAEQNRLREQMEIQLMASPDTAGRVSSDAAGIASADATRATGGMISDNPTCETQKVPNTPVVQPNAPAVHKITALARKAIAIGSRGAIVKKLSKGSATDQIEKLNEMIGTGNLSGSRLRRALMSKAPREMDKAIRNFRKQGKEISVDSLCHEVKTTPGFLEMCENAGLSLEWFENLARERMEASNEKRT
jgi:hypothetical protein